MTFQEEPNNEKKPRSINWLPWLLVAVMGGLLLFNYFDTPGTSGISTGISTSGYSWLSLLLVLACPLMMVFMMSGHGSSCHRHSDENQEDHSAHAGHKGCCSGQTAKKNLNQ